jgi:predicted HTH domain antitoxin
MAVWKEFRIMGPARLELDADIVALLEAQDRPIQETARELIVLELCREGRLSGGRAAEILRLSREDFIRRAADRGIPYFQFDADELRREGDASESF